MIESQNVDMIQWADAVAAELGNGWVATRFRYHSDEPQPNMARLFGPNGEHLHVRIGGWRNEGRATIVWDINSELTRFAGYKVDTRKEITVAADKTAKRIAGDITRRLLPGLVELLAELTERKETSDAEDARRDAFLADMAAALGGHVTDHGGRSSRPEVHFGIYDNGGTIEAYYDDTAEIKVRVPRAVAAQVVKAIAEARQS